MSSMQSIAQIQQQAGYGSQDRTRHGRKRGCKCGRRRRGAPSSPGRGGRVHPRRKTGLGRRRARRRHVRGAVSSNASPKAPILIWCKLKNESFQLRR
ncbi:ORF12 [Barthadenovirus mellis]|uniref:ORF12 n=1 Tax=Passerine adenovirus 1 TaxID=2779174 RepID=A0A7L9DK93_9ADEN|nr:ORF12 [Passerine adenovirus 1]